MERHLTGPAIEPQSALSKAMERDFTKATVNLYLAGQQHRCTVIDIGYADKILMVECADLEAWANAVSMAIAEIQSRKGENAWLDDLMETIPTL